MPKLPGVDDLEAYFGFSKQLPEWRSQQRVAVDPATISQIIGFDTSTLDSPPDSPGILVRRARKYGGELVPAFETAAALPDYLPAQLHADAWKQAHRIAAGAAIEDPENVEPLQKLARGALRYARKFAKRARPTAGAYQHAPEMTAEVAEEQVEEVAEPVQAVQEARQEPTKPIRRWRDARGFVHAPKPPKPACVEQAPGPRGGKIWDCGVGKDGGAQPKKEPGTKTPEKEQPEAESPEKQPAQRVGPSIEQAGNLILKTREHPTPERVGALAVMLARMPKEQLRQLKRIHGVRADDNTKAGLAAKIAKAATVRITQREHWMQEARKAGVRPEDMLLMSRDIRTAYNDAADTVNNMVSDAREAYAKQFGKLITRRMRAFEDGDHTEIPGFDVLARQMAWQAQYQPLLGAHGYSAEGGVDPNEEEASQKLFAFFAAGKQGRMSFGESQKQAIDLIKSGQRKPAAEATPFARRGESVHA